MWVVDLIETVGYGLLFWAALAALREYERRREAVRLDVVLVVASLAAAWMADRFPLTVAGPALHLLTLLLLLAHPYLLVRLVRHFRDTSVSVRRAFAAFAIVGAVLLGLTAGTDALEPLSAGVVYGVGAALTVYAVAAFAADARRSRGVTSWRLTFAALGAAAWSLLWLFKSGANLLSWHEAPFMVVRLSRAFIHVCYFLAFGTPRWLRRRWQGAEQAAYLRTVAERDAENGGRYAPGDLLGAAARSMAHGLIVVATRISDVRGPLGVTACTDGEWLGRTVTPGAGLIGQVLDARTAVSAPLAACEPDLARDVGRTGSRVLAAPIVAASDVWGILLVVQRPGSLFPDDDLRLLAQLARYAATALDHARLVGEARARERRAGDQRVRDAEARMARMLDSIHDYAMMVLDEHGRVLAWYAGAEAVFGHRLGEVLGEHAAVLYTSTASEFAFWLEEARRSGQVEREGPCQRRDGSRFVGQTSVRPLVIGAERDAGFVVVTRDVTQQRELEDRLRQGQKLEAIGQLAGGVAHDFNNLLAAILGYADCLALEIPDDDPRHTHVEQIQKAGDRASALTRQLVAFSRRELLRPAVINLSALVGEMLPIMRRLIGERIEIEPALDPGIVAVVGDRTQLEQVLLNLSVNARDAMPAGGRLTIRTAQLWLDESVARDAVPGSYVLLEVTDTGVGMDAATQAHIFEPFFTTKDVGRGTGLGLATVYGIVKQMGGLIRVSSDPGRGARFQLYFPEAPTTGAVNAGVAASNAEVFRGSGTILVVEDEPSVRAYVQQLLEQHGYRVLAAEQGSAALALLQAHTERIDLIVIDVVTSGGTAPELIEAFARLRPGTPTLSLSGVAEPAPARSGATRAPDQFVQKPFAAADLLGRVRDLLR